MAKFKVGDRCRIVYVDKADRYGIGDIVTVDQDNSQAPWIRLSDGSRFVVSENQLELIQDHQPITPKVGERYRVVKELKGFVDLDNEFTIGHVYKVLALDADDSTTLFQGDRNTWWVNAECLTTEYLELVEEPKEINIVTTKWSRTFGWNSELKPDSIIYTNEYEEPIKQPIIKTMTNFIKKLTQSAADKTLEKANFVNSCGELTATGRDAMLSLVFQEKKDALVKLAEDVIAEEKE
jgi:hypothetical protein